MFQGIEEKMEMVFNFFSICVYSLFDKLGNVLAQGPFGFFVFSALALFCYFTLSP